MINDILDLQKQGLFVKTEEDEEDFTNPECVPLKVVKLLPENMRRKIDKMIEDRKDRRKEEENGQVRFCLNLLSDRNTISVGFLFHSKVFLSNFRALTKNSLPRTLNGFVGARVSG